MTEKGPALFPANGWVHHEQVARLEGRQHAVSDNQAEKEMCPQKRHEQNEGAALGKQASWNKPGLAFCRIADWQSAALGTRRRPGDFMSLFEKPDLGSTGYQPVPSGDSPDGRKRAFPAKLDAGFVARVAPLSFGGSPTEAGESPAPPIFKTGSKSAIRRSAACEDSTQY